VSNIEKQVEAALDAFEGFARPAPPTRRGVAHSLTWLLDPEGEAITYTYTPYCDHAFAEGGEPCPECGSLDHTPPPIIAPFTLEFTEEDGQHYVEVKPRPEND
jgi:hypothetical protein